MQVVEQDVVAEDHLMEVVVQVILAEMVQTDSVVVVGLAGDGWGWHRGRGQEVVGVMGQESAVCLPAAASPCLIQCILDPLA